MCRQLSSLTPGAVAARVKSSLLAGIAFTLSPLNVFLSPAAGSQLDFTLTGTLVSPTGVSPFLAPEFRIDFRLPSHPDQADLLFWPFRPVAVYTTATYSNGGLTTPPLPHTYVLFNPGGEANLPGFQYGGIYIFFSPTNGIPYGLAIQIEVGVPQLYSNTDTEPHFSPGTIDLSGALRRSANQGAAGPGDSPISRPVLSITPADTSPPIISISTSLTRLWPPNGAMAPVRVTGSISEDEPAGGGLNLSTATYLVTDEYGAVQPSGTVDLQPDGGYAFVIPLQALRRETDINGRQYTITITAQDYAGNTGSASTHIIVPHDMRRVDRHAQKARDFRTSRGSQRR